MKISLAFPGILLAGLLAPSPCVATVIGITTVEQPVNLAAKSDPARIPLGAVGVFNNHGYGVQQMIVESRPSPAGAMRWDGGSELDQNLASVFGIAIEIGDSTQIHAGPVTLRVKPWKPAAYSPYTKEQVLAATLWCLIRSAGGTSDLPLEVRVAAEADEDKPLEAKYSGKFVTRPGKDGKEVPPPQVPGTLLETDDNGIAWVRFPEVAASAKSPPPTNGFIVLANEGDGDTGWHLLPVWGNGSGVGDALNTNNLPATMLYSAWYPHGLREANSFLSQGGVHRFEATAADAADTISLSYPQAESDTLAANLLALVLTSRPTETRPLRVSFTVEEAGAGRYAKFRNAPGWTERPVDTLHQKSSVFECEFVWDGVAKKLARGSVPGIRLSDPGWIVPDPPAP